LLSVGCASTERFSDLDGYGRSEGAVLAMLDMSGQPADVFVGISGPYSTKERMVQEAILSCARLIALSEAVALDNRLVTQWNSDKGLRSFATESNAYYDGSRLVDIVNRLEVLTVSFDENAGAIVTARDRTHESGKRPEVGGYGADGRPAWTKEHPQVAGFRFGVGTSGIYRYLNDSLEAADFAAAQDLLDRYTDQLYVKGYTKLDGGAMETAAYQESTGLLQGFMVVARYFDVAAGTYWSLAAVPIR